MLFVWERSAHTPSWRREAHREMGTSVPTCRDQGSKRHSWWLNPLAPPVPLHPCPLQPPLAGLPCSISTLRQISGQPQLCAALFLWLWLLIRARASLGELWTGQRVSLPCRCSISTLCCAIISVPIYSCPQGQVSLLQTCLPAGRFPLITHMVLDPAETPWPHQLEALNAWWVWHIPYLVPSSTSQHALPGCTTGCSPSPNCQFKGW